ncbi:MAG TPA: DUF2283 domain-containing protein [Caulobacteraceae bacterium]|jgi:uncharacterized protein YuzE|nr:DUF2283 domain-containing protein [Caulobacteraceae bacterium]
MISTTYDADADAIYVRLAARNVAETRELEPGLILDLDSGGRIVGVEILNVRARAGEGAVAA